MTSVNRNLLFPVRLVILLVVSFHWTSALKCFQCQIKDGAGDADCEKDPVPEKYLRECAQPQCWLRYSSNGTLSVERFCVGYATNTNNCVTAVVVDPKGIAHSGLECRCNNADGCNGNSPSGTSGESEDSATTEQMS